MFLLRPLLLSQSFTKQLNKISWTEFFILILFVFQVFMKLASLFFLKLCKANYKTDEYINPR